MKYMILALLTVSTAHASVLWRGDFETGNLTQYSGKQMVSPDRLAIVTSPVREGRYAMKATVRQGDNPINASGNRNELVSMTRETPGLEYSYSWSVMFDATFPSANTWQLFTQWHQDSCCGSPPMEFYVVGEQLRLRVGGDSGRILWTAPLRRAKWYDFAMSVKWSVLPTVGFVELFVDGNLVVPRTMIATQFGNEANYLKLGLYRNASIAPIGIVYHDGFTMYWGPDAVASSRRPKAVTDIKAVAWADIVYSNIQPLEDSGVGCSSGIGGTGWSSFVFALAGLFLIWIGARNDNE